jgi:hypothetical protein
LALALWSQRAHLSKRKKAIRSCNHTLQKGRSLLRRGQIGTVIIPDPAGAYEVEFADRDGRAFAILSLRPERLMVLHEHPRLRCRVRFFPDLSACMSITARAGQSTTDRSGTSERSERQLTTLRSGVTARAEEKTGLNFLCIRGIMKRGRFTRVIVPPPEAPAPLSAQNKK